MSLAGQVLLKDVQAGSLLLGLVPDLNVLRQPSTSAQVPMLPVESQTLHVT